VFEINGKHILITGGSSGFGRHFARFLAGNGAHVTLAARRAEALASAVAEINGSGGIAQSVVLDVTVSEKIDAARSESLNAALALHYRYRFDPAGLAPAERGALRAHCLALAGALD